MVTKIRAKYLVNGKWITEEQYLNITEKEWEKIEKNRKKIIK